MAPKGMKRQNDKMRARQWQARGLKLSKQADCFAVCHILQHRSDEVLELKRKYIEKKWMDDDANTFDDKFIVDYQDTQVKEETSPTKREENLTEVLQNIPIDLDKVKNLGMLKNLFLRLLCNYLEPISLGPYAIKGLVARGSKEPPREPMLQLIEGMCDVSPTARITLTSLYDIAEWLQLKNQANGGRFGSVTFPLDFSGKDCLYQHTFTETGDLTIIDTTTGKDITLEQVYAPETDDPPQVVFDMGFSKMRASVTVEGTAIIEENLVTLFQSHGVNTLVKPKLDGHGKVAKQVASPQSETTPRLAETSPQPGASPLAAKIEVASPQVPIDAVFTPSPSARQKTLKGLQDNAPDAVDPPPTAKRPRKAAAKGRASNATVSKAKVKTDTSDQVATGADAPNPTSEAASSSKPLAAAKAQAKADAPKTETSPLAKFFKPMQLGTSERTIKPGLLKKKPEA